MSRNVLDDGGWLPYPLNIVLEALRSVTGEEDDPFACLPPYADIASIRRVTEQIMREHNLGDSRGRGVSVSHALRDLCKLGHAVVRIDRDQKRYAPKRGRL